MFAGNGQSRSGCRDCAETLAGAGALNAGLGRELARRRPRVAHGFSRENPRRSTILARLPSGGTSSRNPCLPSARPRAAKPGGTFHAPGSRTRIAVLRRKTPIHFRPVTIPLDAVAPRRGQRLLYAFRGLAPPIGTALRRSRDCNRFVAQATIR